MAAMRIAIFLLALLLVSASACDPGAGITWVNETDRRLNVYLGDDLDDFDLTLPPRSSVRAATIEIVWSGIVVIRDEQGVILARHEISWEELKAQGFRFVITEEGLSPTALPER